MGAGKQPPLQHPPSFCGRAAYRSSLGCWCMRAVAARASSSMHALVGAAVAAAANGTTIAGLGSLQHSSSSGGGSRACRSSRRTAAGWSKRSSASHGPLCLLHSDAARQRRLVAAPAAAEPSLAEDSLDMWEGAAPVPPPPEPQQGGSTRQQQPQQPLLQVNGTRNGQATAEAAGQAGVPLPAALPLFEAATLPAAGYQPAVQEAAPAAAVSLQVQPLAQPFQLPVPNLGYTCLNIELQQRFGIRTNRWAAAALLPRVRQAAICCLTDASIACSL